MLFSVQFGSSRKVAVPLSYVIFFLQVTCCFASIGWCRVHNTTFRTHADVYPCWCIPCLRWFLSFFPHINSVLHILFRCQHTTTKTLFFLSITLTFYLSSWRYVKWLCILRVSLKTIKGKENAQVVQSPPAWIRTGCSFVFCSTQWMRRHTTSHLCQVENI